MGDREKEEEEEEEEEEESRTRKGVTGHRGLRDHTTLFDRSCRESGQGSRTDMSKKSKVA
jgi:hypothetical protein